MSKGGRPHGTWGETLRSGQLYGGKKKKNKKSKKRSDDFTCRDADLKKLIRNARSEFFLSREWQDLRYRVLRANNGRCELCGRSKKDDVSLHVDHIKPRSRFPELALEITNLQVLCEDCNMGKGNRCTRDWRTNPDDLYLAGDPQSKSEALT